MYWPLKSRVTILCVGERDRILCFLFFILCTQFFSFFRLQIFACMVQCCVHISLLSVPLIHDPSPFQGGVSCPGAGTNMECAETVHRRTFVSLNSYLASDLLSLAVELDTQWRCALRRLAQDKTLHRLQLGGWFSTIQIRNERNSDFVN